MDAGYVNLRIKSSKAFPLNDVSAIEELISKVKKVRDSGERIPADYGGGTVTGRDLIQSSYEVIDKRNIKDQLI